MYNQKSQPYKGHNGWWKFTHDYSCCPRFKWKIQEIEFTDSIRLVKLGVHDMIFGEDWLKSYNSVLLDFVDYESQVSHKGQRVKLKGICISRIICKVWKNLV